MMNSDQKFEVGDFVRWDTGDHHICHRPERWIFGIVAPLRIDRDRHGGCPVKFRSSNVAVRLTTGYTFYLKKEDVELIAKAKR